MTTATTIPTTLTRDSLVEKPRIASIDIMRGIVMVIMALDHTRDFYHETTGVFDPTDLTKTNPILFFTRIITHFCAPTFVFLSGVSAYISTQRKPLKELSVFLLTRGLWLVFLEFTVVRFGILFNLYYDFIIFQVIWVIGASMVVLAGLVFLPQRTIFILGLVLVFGHNLLDLIKLTPEDPGYFIWGIIQQAGFYSSGPEKSYLMAYPLVPWLGIMLTGYGAGFLYHKNYDTVKRKNILLYSGITAIILFVILRFTNVYGDPSSWSTQKNGMFTLMSFLNVTKYPVSLQYTLMTLGPVLIVMSWMENIKTNIFEPMRIIGRVPLFYYILHFYLIHFSSLCVYMITTGTSWSDVDFHFSKSFGGIPAGAGYSLGWVYVAWISIVVVLYPLCKWYHRYKSTHRHWWLGYL
jgi:uncharacterized membrane protein